MKRIRIIFIFLLGLIAVNCSEPIAIESQGGVKGVIIDKDIQEPLNGVSVSISPIGTTVITGSDGIYEFDNLDVMQYTIEVSKSKYNSESKSVEITAGETTQIDFALQRGNGTIKLSKEMLDFGAYTNSLAFDITNTGDNDLFFNIESSYDWLIVDPTSGKISPTKTTPITVSIDRLKIEEETSVILPVTSNAGSVDIEIRVTK